MPDHPRTTAQLLLTSGLDNLLSRVEKHRHLLRLIQAYVPDALSAHCRDCVADGSRLVLYTDGPAWAFQFRFHAPNILARLKDEHGLNFRDLQIRNLTAAESRPQKEAPHPLKSPEASAVIRACADQAGTEELKKSLGRLAETLKRLTAPP